MKILFIGDGYPLGTNAGSILYKRLIEVHGIDKFCYYGVGYTSKNNWPIEFEKMPKKTSSLRIWPQNRVIKYFERIPFVEEFFYFLLIPIIRRKIKQFAIENEITIIFAVLRADVLAIINKLVNETKYKLIGYISDTVEAEYLDKPLIYRYKFKEYYKAIGISDGVCVAGESMDDFITNKYKKKTSILRLGYKPNYNERKLLLNTNEKEIRFFFSGSVYAKNEFETFLKAVTLFSIKHKTYKIILVTATNYKIKIKPEYFVLTELGWLAEEMLIYHMSRAHIGYVPYIFNEENKVQMTYAFPSKIGFYLSTGLPVFFHGPVYSSITSFFNKYECGIHCSTLNLEGILTALEKIIFDLAFYNQCIENGIIAFENEFTTSVLKNRFNRFIANCV